MPRDENGYSPLTTDQHVFRVANRWIRRLRSLDWGEAFVKERERYRNIMDFPHLEEYQPLLDIYDRMAVALRARNLRMMKKLDKDAVNEWVRLDRKARDEGGNLYSDFSPIRFYRLPYSNSEMPCPDFGDLVKQILLIRDSFDDVRFDGSTIRVRTPEPIVLHDPDYGGDYDLGHYYMDITPDRWVIRVAPTETTVGHSIDEHIIHPHVENTGLCTGQGYKAMEAARERGDLHSMLEITYSILSTYNPDSPFRELWTWFGAQKCESCWEPVPEDEMVECPECEHRYCPTCMNENTVSDIYDTSICEGCAVKSMYHGGYISNRHAVWNSLTRDYYFIQESTRLRLCSNDNRQLDYYFPNAWVRPCPECDANGKPSTIPDFRIEELQGFEYAVSCWGCYQRECSIRNAETTAYEWERKWSDGRLARKMVTLEEARNNLKWAEEHVQKEMARLYDEAIFTHNRLKLEEEAHRMNERWDNGDRSVILPRNISGRFMSPEAYHRMNNPYYVPPRRRTARASDVEVRTEGGSTIQVSDITW